MGRGRAGSFEKYYFFGIVSKDDPPTTPSFLKARKLPSKPWGRQLSGNCGRPQIGLPSKPWGRQVSGERERPQIGLPSQLGGHQGKGGELEANRTSTQQLGLPGDGGGGSRGLR